MTPTRPRPVRWRDAALDDLSKIIDDIGVHAPRAAERLEARIFRKTDLLELFPHLGSVCPWYRKARFVVVGKYVVYYTVHRSETVIRAIVHGARRFRGSFLRR